MTDSELEDMERVAPSQRDYLIIRLGGRVGLCAFEIPQIKSKHVRRTSDGEHSRLHVPEGKETSGNGGKLRDAYLPGDVEGDLHRYQTAEDIGRDEPLIDLTERGVRNVMKRAAERAAEETGNENWHHISSHDFRRRFAQRFSSTSRLTRVS